MACIVGQDDELRRPAIVMGAKADDVDNLTKARPLWMFDNESEYVKEFLDSNRIGELDQIFNQPVGERTEVYRHPDERNPHAPKRRRHRDDRGVLGARIVEQHPEVHTPCDGGHHRRLQHRPPAGVEAGGRVHARPLAS